MEFRERECWPVVNILSGMGLRASLLINKNIEDLVLLIKFM